MLGFHLWINSYQLNEISNLRVDLQRIFSSSRPMLMFDRKGRTKIFGQFSGMKWKINHAVNLLDPVYERLPNLRPGSPPALQGSPQR